jgi:hypothetical protein
MLFIRLLTGRQDLIHGKAPDDRQPQHPAMQQLFTAIQQLFFRPFTLLLLRH